MSSKRTSIEVAKGVGYVHLPCNSRLVTKGTKVPLTNGALFLDRDGVLVEDVHFLTSPDNLKILPGVPQALRQLKDQYYIVVVTNQSGIARGHLREENLLAIHRELVERLAVHGAILDALYYCPHLPEGPMDAYRGQCQCRKPLPGMLLDAKRTWGLDLASSVMLGDAQRDMDAGQAAGVRCIRITGETGSNRARAESAVTLGEAAELLQGQIIQRSK